MNTLVSFELAKLLKEKGFDIPVRNYYLIKENGKFLHEGFEDRYWGDNRIVNWNKDVVGIKPFEGFISSPTIAEVVMWFYEKHGIWIYAYQYKDHAADVNDTSVFRTNATGNKEFKSPTEAYESAIKYTLENLI